MSASARCALIVNADDFGLTLKVNAGIEAAHRHGVLSSTSVMVNQSASGDAAGLSERLPALGVGLHVTLTLGRPLAPPSQVRSLVDDDGTFLPRPAFIRRLRAGEIDAGEVAAESGAQLARLRALGIEPDHWNVHQHLQEWPLVGRAVATTMADAGLLTTRTSRRLWVGGSLGFARIVEVRREYKRRMLRRSLAHLECTPDALLEHSASRWAGVMALLPDAAVIEALCHPGEADDAEVLVLTPDLARERGLELAALLDPGLRESLERNRVRLATFAESVGARAESVEP